MVNGIDLFKEYVLEKNGQFVHYDEQMRGFICYSFHRRQVDECFIDEWFVLENHRSIKTALDLVRFVENEAKSRGCKMLTCACNINQANASRILNWHLRYGFKPFHLETSFIYMGKDIQ